MIKKEILLLLGLVFLVMLSLNNNITGLVTSQQISQMECRNREIKINNCNVEGAKMVVDTVIKKCFSCRERIAISSTRSGKIILPRKITVSADCTNKERDEFIAEIRSKYHEFCITS
mgnify:CR=1 FL=1